MGSREDAIKDEILTAAISTPHAYSIHDNERINMTLYDTYSIDPIGCKDADDAFPLYIVKTIKYTSQFILLIQLNI